jgi:hypothetical protein
MLRPVTARRDLSIRPLGVGGMIDRAVALTLRHFRALFVAMLLVQAPAFALLRLTSERTGDLLPLLADPPALAARAAGLTGLLAGVSAALVVLQFLATAAAAAIVAPSLAGHLAAPTGLDRARSIGLAALLQLGTLSLAPLLGAAPGLWLALRAGSATTAVLGLVGAAAGALVLFLVALLRTVLAPAAAAVEGCGGWAALRRSSRLMAPRPGQPLLDRPGVRASLLLLTTFLLALAVNGLASLPRLLAARAAGLSPLAMLPGALPPALELLLTLFEACAGAALQPFSLAAVAVFYFERRARAEGLDLAAWVAGLEAR